MKKGLLSVFVIFGLLCLVAPAGAHMFWLNPSDCYPAVGSEVEIGIGWGHKFPANRVDGEVKEDSVEAVEAVDPQGQAVEVKRLAADRYQLKVDQPGAYVVTARMKPGFFTMTPEGRKWGDRKSVAEAVKCTNFHMLAKTVVFAGGEPGNRTASGKQALEMIPVGDSALLKAGGVLKAEVRFEGRALADTQINALFAGYEPEKTDDAGAKDKGHGAATKFPVQLKTDSQGRVDLPLERAGFWLAILSHNPPYPDKTVCDEYMFNTTYAFEVR